MNKKVLLTIGGGLIVLVLGGAAIFTAMQLQQAGTEPVAPNVPQSQPRAQQADPLPNNPVELSFTVGGGSVATSGAAAATTFTITVTQGSNGTISPGTTTVNSGASQTFTITPSSGYQVSSVTVDGTSQGAINTYTFSAVSASHTLTAAFTQSSASSSGSSSSGTSGTSTSGSAVGGPASTSTPKPSATAKPATSSAQTLPEAGMSLPTIIGISGGILLLFAGLILAL